MHRLTSQLKATGRRPSPVRWRWRLLVLALAAGGWAAPATRGQEADPAKLVELKAMSLEQLLEVKVDLVYGASRYAQKTTEAPSSITIVSQAEIKRYGHRTLAEVLQSVPGLQVSYDRNYSYLGARGLNLGDFNSRMLLLIDGHRVNNDLNDGAAIGTDCLLDVDLIERVEVIRGPGSVLYGNNAFFGIINVITRHGNSVNGAEVAGTYGRFDTYQGRVTLGKAFTNGLELLLSAAVYDSAGPQALFFKEYNDPAHNNGIAQDMDADRYGSFFGTVSYQDLTLQGGYISREKVNPTALQFTTFNDPSLRTVDERSYVDLKFAHEFPAAVDVNARLYYDRNQFQIGYPVGEPVASAVYDQNQAGEWWGAELQLNKKLWEQHILSAGADYRDDFRQDRSGSAAAPATRSRQSHGVFLLGDFTLRKNLHFNGGLRYDQYGEFDPTVNPRMALIYEPFRSATLKAIYGTAFRSPSFLELSDPRFQDIRPEKIKSYELVYEQGIGPRLRSSVAGYINRMQDLIIFEDGHFDNTDAESRGVELALAGNWAGDLRGRISYAFQKTERSAGNEVFPDSPEHLFKLNLSVPLVREKLFGSLEYQYTSSRHTVLTDVSANTIPGMDAKGFGVFNFTLFSQNLVRNLEISASVYNLLDQAYADPSTRYHLQDQLPRDGRSFRLKLTYRF